jgi:bla regulator protein blaR1
MRCVALFVMWPIALLAQSGAVPAFDVASVKPSRMLGPRDTSVNPNGISYSNVTVIDCVAAAWNVKPSQISGGPDWSRSDRYDVAAKTTGSTDKDHLMMLLQTLLADRFKLMTHRETRQRAVYLLTAVQNGPKFHASDDAGTESVFVDGGIAFRKMSMPALADYLTALTVIDRPVLDRTGLKGSFDFTLRLFEEHTGMTGFDKKFAMRDAEHVFTDLQEQLGLRLEPARAPVETLVINRAERPSEN